MFPQSVRPSPQFYQRSTAPSSQNQRMPSHNNRVSFVLLYIAIITIIDSCFDNQNVMRFFDLLFFQPPQQMYHHQPQVYSVQQPVYIPNIHYNPGNRQPNFVQTLPVYQGPHFPYPYNTTPTPPPTPLPCKYYD